MFFVFCYLVYLSLDGLTKPASVIYPGFVVAIGIVFGGSGGGGGDGGSGWCCSITHPITDQIEFSNFEFSAFSARRKEHITVSPDLRCTHRKAFLVHQAEQPRSFLSPSKSQKAWSVLELVERCSNAGILH